MSDWQPIETAPKGQRVLIGGGGCPFVHENTLRCYGSFGCAWLGLGDKQQPTHWMPLPEPPTINGVPPMTPTRPIRIWNMGCPFRKNGTPVMGNMGSSIRSVVVMTAEEFKRLIAENPALNTVQFEIGTFDDE